jgi:P4 family phage/plasmid primase-like protien
MSAGQAIPTEIPQARQDITDKAITDILLAQHVFYCDINDPSSSLYIYSDGQWSINKARNVILHDVALMLKEESSRSKMNLEKIENFIKGDVMYNFKKPKPADWIAFRNGFLKLKTMGMDLLSPEYFYTNVIPHDFDPKAQCPEWEVWLGEVVRSEDIPFIQEWMGYSLYTDSPEAAFLILTGSGQNGKSIFLEIMVALIGEENVSTISLADLTYGEYQLAELHNKLANIADDIENKSIKSVGRLRAASSGGRINGRHIYGAPFDFKSYAKITYSCNEPPEIQDESDAVKMRLKVVEFPYTFAKNPLPGQKQAKDRKALVEALKKELPGIARWAVDGLKRFLDNGGRFSFSQSTEDVWTFYKRRAKPTVSFVNECLEFTDDEQDVIEKEPLYRAFRQWLKDANIKLDVSRDKFFRDLKNEGIEARQSREYDRRRVYFGMKLKCHNEKRVLAGKSV